MYFTKVLHLHPHNTENNLEVKSARLKGERDKLPNTLGDVDTPLSGINRTSRQRNQDRKPEQSTNLT